MPTSALQVASTGLEAQDARMRVIANNLANVGTTGFKRDRANFATLAYQDARVAGQRSSGETAYATGLNLGTGVAVQSTSQIMTQGALSNTGNAFDLALDGDGYFQVEMPGGQLSAILALAISRLSAGRSAGHPAGLCQYSHRSRCPKLAPRQSRSRQTAPFRQQLPNQAEPDRGGTDPDRSLSPTHLACKRLVTTYLVETAASGAAELAPAGAENGRGNVRQGMLESSNVNIVQELVEMIEAQRAYEISSKMVSAVDEMLRNANQTL